MEGAAARPGRTLPLGGKTRYPFYRRLGGSQGPVWTGAENLVPTGIRSRTVQPGSSVAIPTKLPGPPLKTVIFHIYRHDNPKYHVEYVSWVKDRVAFVLN